MTSHVMEPCAGVGAHPSGQCHPIAVLSIRTAGLGFCKWCRQPSLRCQPAPSCAPHPWVICPVTRVHTPRCMLSSLPWTDVPGEDVEPARGDHPSIWRPHASVPPRQPRRPPVHRDPLRCWLPSPFCTSLHLACLCLSRQWGWREGTDGPRIPYVTGSVCWPPCSRKKRGSWGPATPKII